MILRNSVVQYSNGLRRNGFSGHHELFWESESKWDITHSKWCKLTPQWNAPSRVHFPAMTSPMENSPDGNPSIRHLPHFPVMTSGLHLETNSSAENSPANSHWPPALMSCRLRSCPKLLTVTSIEGSFQCMYQPQCLPTLCQFDFVWLSPPAHASAPHSILIWMAIKLHWSDLKISWNGPKSFVL